EPASRAYGDHRPGDGPRQGTEDGARGTGIEPRGSDPFDRDGSVGPLETRNRPAPESHLRDPRSLCGGRRKAPDRLAGVSARASVLTPREGRRDGGGPRTPLGSTLKRWAASPPQCFASRDRFAGSRKWWTGPGNRWPASANGWAASEHWWSESEDYFAGS